MPGFSKAADGPSYPACCLVCLASLAPGCLAAWLPGRLAAWPPGCLADLPPGWPGCVACLAAWLPAYLAVWLSGSLAERVALAVEKEGAESF